MIENVSASISAMKPLDLIKPSQSADTTATPSESIKNFGSYLKDAIDSVASQETNAQEMNNQYMLGKVNTDQVMVASEQALLSLQFTSQVRNKVIEAYQEIMRTQV